MQDKQFTFMLEAYKAYIEYYRSYIDGMWVRFNTLLAINTALAGVYGTTFTNSPVISSRGEYLFPFLGLVAATLLYTQSAQEKYIVTKLRAKTNEVKGIIQGEIDLEEFPALFSPLDEIDTKQRKFIREGFIHWRSYYFGITNLPIIVSLIFFILWVVIILISVFKSVCKI